MDSKTPDYITTSILSYSGAVWLNSRLLIGWADLDQERPIWVEIYHSVTGLATRFYGCHTDQMAHPPKRCGWGTLKTLHSSFTVDGQDTPLDELDIEKPEDLSGEISRAYKSYWNFECGTIDDLNNLDENQVDCLEHREQPEVLESRTRHGGKRIREDDAAEEEPEPVRKKAKKPNNVRGPAAQQQRAKRQKKNEAKQLTSKKKVQRRQTGGRSDRSQEDEDTGANCDQDEETGARNARCRNNRPMDDEVLRRWREATDDSEHPVKPESSGSVVDDEAPVESFPDSVIDLTGGESTNGHSPDEQHRDTSPNPRPIIPREFLNRNLRCRNEDFEAVIAAVRSRLGRSFEPPFRVLDEMKRELRESTSTSDIWKTQAWKDWLGDTSSTLMNN